MKTNLPLLLILSTVLLNCYGETLTKTNVPITNMDIPRLEDALESQDHVITLFHDRRNIEDNKLYLDFLTAISEKIGEKYPNAVIGKIIAEDNAHVPKYFRFEEYPSLAYFNRGKKNIYKGSLDLDKFLSWAASLDKTTIVPLKGQVSLDQFIASSTDSKLLAFYSADATDELAALNEIVNKDLLRTFDIYQVGLCLEDCEINGYNGHTFKRNSLAVIRDFVNLEPLAVKTKGLDDVVDIMEFVNKEAVPVVQVIDEISIAKLFAGYAPIQMILFADPQADNEEILKSLEESALHNRKEDLYYERALHAVFYFDDKWEEIKTFFSKYDRSKLPAMFITQVTDDGIVKYEFKKEKINLETLKEFLEDFRNKDLQKMLISEDVPETQDGPITKLVGKNFRREVVMSKEEYVVLLYDQLSSQSTQTAYKLLKHINEKIVNISKLNITYEGSGVPPPKTDVKFGYIDMLKNEVAQRNYAQYPQILLYMKGKKNRPAEFDLPLTPKALVAWLNSMLPDLELTMTDEEENDFIQEHYSPEEKEKFERMKQTLIEQKKKFSEGLLKGEIKPESKSDTGIKITPEKEEKVEILSLGGPSIAPPTPMPTSTPTPTPAPSPSPSPSKKEEVPIKTEKKSDKMTAPKGEPNTDL